MVSCGVTCGVACGVTCGRLRCAPARQSVDVAAVRPSAAIVTPSYWVDGDTGNRTLTGIVATPFSFDLARFPRPGPPPPRPSVQAHRVGCFPRQQCRLLFSAAVSAALLGSTGVYGALSGHELAAAAQASAPQSHPAQVLAQAMPANGHSVDIVISSPTLSFSLNVQNGQYTNRGPGDWHEAGLDQYTQAFKMPIRDDVMAFTVQVRPTIFFFFFFNSRI